MLSDPSYLFFLVSVPPLLGRAVLSTGITGATMGNFHSVFSSFEWLYPVMIHKMKGELDSELSLSFFGLFVWFSVVQSPSSLSSSTKSPSPKFSGSFQLTRSKWPYCARFFPLSPFSIYSKLFTGKNTLGSRRPRLGIVARQHVRTWENVVLDAVSAYGECKTRGQFMKNSLK